MTVFTVTGIIQNYTPTSKQSNKHILIVVKMSSISDNNIGGATEIESGSKDTYTHKDCVRLKRVFLLLRIYTNSLVSMKE